jgi:hypothetical protein
VASGVARALGWPEQGMTARRSVGLRAGGLERYSRRQQDGLVQAGRGPKQQSAAAARGTRVLSVPCKRWAFATWLRQDGAHKACA